MSDRQWIILRFRGDFPYLTVKYSDSSGHRAENRASWSPGATSEEAYFDLLTRTELNSKLRHLPGSNPLSVPVYLDFGDLWMDQDWDWLAQHPTIQTEFPEVQAVLLSRARPVRRPAFRLPLRILAVDAADMAVANFRTNPWFQEAEGYGIRVDLRRKDDLVRYLRSTGTDILIFERGLNVREQLYGLPESRKPRLLVILDPWPLPDPRGGQISRPRGRILAGTAELCIRTHRAHFVSSFLYQIVHDMPLHEAMRLARREINMAPAAIRLTADPLTNHSLRLFDAFLALRHENDRIDPMVARVEAVHPRAAEMARSMRTAMAGPPDWSFTRETLGLVPMANMRLGLLQASQFVTAQAAVSVRLSTVAVSEDQRVVNVALRRLETEPRLSIVPASSTLKPECEYELGISIGDRLAQSLVTGPQPAIAPLFPPLDDESGHELELAIHAKDFRLVSERVQRLRLPRVGPSNPAYFRIRSPRNNGWAQLRICIYYRNQMVQSYLLAAEIAGTDDPAGWELQRNGTVLGARLEYSRSKDRPWDLEGLKERVLSLGVNQSAKTHEVILKSTQTSGELTLLPSTFDPEVNDLRNELDGLSADQYGYERVFPKVLAGQQPAADVAEAFRNLIRRGRNLYKAFFNAAAKTGSVRKALATVASSSDEKIQVIRFDDHFVFPWTLLYDFPLPDEREGDPPRPLCLGQEVDAAGATVSCSHTNKDQVYCVRGFWGVRHYTEELLEQSGGKATSISRPAKGPLRLVAASNLTESAGLETDLKSIENATEVGPAGGKPLLDLLWADPSQRPSILVFLAHLEKEDKPGEPKGVRIFLGGADWLTLNELSNKVTSGVPEWNDPRPIVLQMTCDSADVDVTTLNHFLLQWNTAGAAAIVGTEARVGAGIAARCAKSLSAMLWNKTPLGQAVTGYRRELVFEGNPLGFLFTAYGDVDLAVQ
jgi:hypothetical protein